MQNDVPKTEVNFTDKFKRNLRILAKKYRNIRRDIQPVIKKLESGELPGDIVPGVGYTIFKLRIKNSNIQKGKSGGYRVIYYVKTKTQVILITIYSTSEHENIAASEIRDIIADYKKNN